MDTIGVFFCSGCSIGDAIDLDAVAEVADENGATSTHSHPCLCAPEGLQSIPGRLPRVGGGGGPGGRRRWRMPRP